jgi:hypothetical protein
MRRELLDRVGGYSAVAAEDYDLWLKLALNSQLDNVPDHLVDRRVHGEGLSDRYSARLEESVQASMRRAARELTGEVLKCADAEALRATLQGRADEPMLIDSAATIRRLVRAYLKSGRVSASEARDIRREAAARIARLAALARNRGRPGLALRLRFRGLALRFGV